MSYIPEPTDPEPVWTKHIAKVIGGVPEFGCVDGSRADILTKTHAIEVEWVKNWKSGVGQALLYSTLTGRKPMVILLLRGKPSEKVYILRCAVACAAAGVELTYWNTV